MRALFVAVLLLIVPGLASAQNPTYLNDPAMFGQGWSRLVERVGAANDVAEISIRPDAIEVIARAAQGGERLDRFRVTKRTALSFTVHVVSGPEPTQPSGPAANIETSFFPLPGVPMDRLFLILEGAQARVKLDDPGGVASVRIARVLNLLPTRSHGDVRWTIGIASPREQATVLAAADGRVVGVDIAGTNRGRNRNFLLQDDWPLADAAASFRSIVGDRNVVYEIDVSQSSITMNAVSQASANAITNWHWDGGSFRRGLVDSPNLEPIRSRGNLPFKLDEVDVTKIPAVLKAAREKEPSGHARIMIAKAVKERAAVGAPRVLWEVQMVDGRRQIPLVGEDYSERTTVKLTPAAEVVLVILPRSQRPKAEPFAADTVLAAIEKSRVTFGADTRVIEMHFGGNRTRLVMVPADNPGQLREVAVTETGFEDGSGIVNPMMKPADASFTLGDLAKLSKPAFEAMLARARRDVPLPGAVIHGVRFWSGEPFWRPRRGMPHVDIRVGVPPRHDAGGYVVFTVDGKHVETVK